jgi:hypothetical protein
VAISKWPGIRKIDRIFHVCRNQQDADEKTMLKVKKRSRTGPEGDQDQENDQQKTDGAVMCRSNVLT